MHPFGKMMENTEGEREEMQKNMKGKAVVCSCSCHLTTGTHSTMSDCRFRFLQELRKSEEIQAFSLSEEFTFPTAFQALFPSKHKNPTPQTQQHTLTNNQTSGKRSNINISVGFWGKEKPQPKSSMYLFTPSRVMVFKLLSTLMITLSSC